MKKNIYRTAAVVTGLSIAERALGFLYRIVLSRLIGAEGLGLYQVALSVFSVFITLGTGGIPITVSRLISKNKAGGSAKGAPLRRACSARSRSPCPSALSSSFSGANSPFSSPTKGA